MRTKNQLAWLIPELPEPQIHTRMPARVVSHYDAIFIHRSENGDEMLRFGWNTQCVSDISFRVSDVFRCKPHPVQRQHSIDHFSSIFQSQVISNVIVCEGEKYHEMLIICAITRHFLLEMFPVSSIYPFSVENVSPLIRGRYTKLSQIETLETSIAFGMIKFESFNGYSLQTNRKVPFVLLSDRPVRIQFSVNITHIREVRSGVWPDLPNNPYQTLVEKIGSHSMKLNDSPLNHPLICGIR
jgi:hypothetical protein